MRLKTDSNGAALWLSAEETYQWAHRPQSSWPCSRLSGHRLFAAFDSRGDLVDYTVDGKDVDLDSNEFNACVSDHLRCFDPKHPAIRS